MRRWDRRVVGAVSFSAGTRSGVSVKYRDGGCVDLAPFVCIDIKSSGHRVWGLLRQDEELHAACVRRQSEDIY